MELRYTTNGRLRSVLKNSMAQEPASVMEGHYVKRCDRRKTQYWDIQDLDRETMSHFSPTGNFFEIEVRNQDDLMK